MNWKSFLIGALCGILISFLFVYFIGNRYTVSAGGPQGVMAFKLDKWTGKSWMARYYEKDGGKVWYWEKMKEN